MATSRSLCEALLARDWPKAEALVAAGEGVTYVDPYGRSVLHTAIMQEAPVPLVELIVRAGADPNLRDMSFRRTPIHTAVMYDAPAGVFRALLDGRGDVNCVDKFGKCPSDYIVSKALNPEAIRVLIEFGANVNLTNLLHQAVCADRPVEVIRALLRGGAHDTRHDLIMARQLRTRNGNDIIYLLLKVEMMTAICSMYLPRLCKRKEPVLPHDLMFELMQMLYGDSPSAADLVPPRRWLARKIRKISAWSCLNPSFD